jgi:hypothetical protein
VASLQQTWLFFAEPLGDVYEEMYGLKTFAMQRALHFGSKSLLNGPREERLLFFWEDALS